MNTCKLALLTSLTLVAGIGALAAPVLAQNYYTPRQYYAPWVKHDSYAYYYRQYYYKPTPTYVGYRYHYAVLYPARPEYTYFYNPHKRVYWGRCPTNHDGQPLYSMLAEKDRKGALKDIPETAFPKPTATPPIPDSTDGASLDLPPEDVPAGVKGIATAAAPPAGE